ncbi:MAG: hypothetical protein ACE5J5_01760 [Candidatus Hydrothermarchaeales archaeon]
MEGLKKLKGFAEELKEKGYTVNVRHNGDAILRMGKEAEPGILSLFGPIEVLDLKAVAKILM